MRRRLEIVILLLVIVFVCLFMWAWLVRIFGPDQHPTIRINPNQQMTTR